MHVDRQPSEPTVEKAGVLQQTRKHVLRLALPMIMACAACGANAATAPSQSPLYNAVPGAKPNVMFVLDNSGSMGFEFQEGYEMQDTCASASCSYAWFRMRDSSVNTQYYNPATTYLPRTYPNGAAYPNPIVFVDNQQSRQFSISIPSVNYSWSSASAPNVPKYAAYVSPQAVPASAKFTYVRCGNASCSSRTTIDLSYPPAAGTVPLPSGHKRTDCGDSTTSTCTKAAELQNVLNWYQWYRNRALAVGTAVGQAMQSYDNKFRIGYAQYNSTDTVNHSYARATSIVRGVRPFADTAASSGSNWKTQFYDWVYGIIPAGGTPSHDALSLVGNYYAGAVNASFGNPWKNDPASTAGTDARADLSCRRSYSIVLSDGAWNAGTSSNADQRYASIASTNYSGNPSGNAAALQFNPAGAPGYNSADPAVRLAARNLYIPYADGLASSKGFADLTARYFWHTDFSAALPNNVPPVPGQHNPTFWQNMTTFTIGWGLTPSGDAGGSGLSWSQIKNYANDWLAGNTATRPSWASGNLDATNSSDQKRVDDFIRAGFTGGGRAYSVYSGEDVRRAVDNALSSMVGAGNDAGVAVSGNSSEFQTLENQFKYTTEYQTSDNSGDVKAFRLNGKGGYLDVDAAGNALPAWSADAKMPALANRKIFALSNYDASAPDASANRRLALTSTTTLGSLPTDMRTLLNMDGLQRPDSSFIRYMLGDDPQTDVNDTVYRPRTQPMGASVNSPPAFVGGRIDMGYDRFGTVDGKDSYAAYKTRKTTLPPTIFAATNDGKVHVLNAAKSDSVLPGTPAGQELASFMPRGAMASQIDLAKSNFRFRYILDGPVVEHDVYDKSGQTPASGSAVWRQLVVGTGGRAGGFMYGLESPLNATHRIPTKDHFLWELDSKTAGYADLANVTNNPTAGQLDDGTWVVLTGSGHYGAGKQVGLYVVEALTGKLRKFIKLPDNYGNDDAGNGGNRGLGGVVAVRDASRRIVAAYAGDANGNLWRFDLRSSKFVVSYGRPLFTTPGGKTQPVYATPTWQTHPGDSSSCQYDASTQCGAIVVVGTGILLDEDDLATPATRQAIYGIWDPTPIGGNDKAGAAKVVLGDLVEQTIDLGSAKSGSGTDLDRTYYQVSANPVDWKTKKGWMLRLGTIRYSGALANGERVVGDLSNVGSSVVITSFLPADRNLGLESCTATGSLPNIMYALDALTGKNKYSFDVDGNGSFDFYAVASIANGGYTRGSATSQNATGLPNEGRPDLKPETNCTSAVAYQTGTTGTVPVGDGCALPRVWRRSWRTVASPPF